MTSGLTSIVIPTYEHGALVGSAIDSALAQTAPVEVIVVDDGSTDDTATVLARYGDRIRVIRQPHSGPSRARNAGLDAATGAFVMWLDADDLIAPTKVERQRAAFSEEIGWVLCDVRIEDEGRGRTELASARYDYPRKNLGGWIAPLLEPANFIPIMAPLVRRQVLVESGIRFADTMDGTPEDWGFWRRVAAVARVRYVPDVLATYRKKKTGRSRLTKAARAIEPNVEYPLRLNLGCGTPGTRSWHPIPGFVNLDKSLGWCFEDGLGDFADASVAGITISHTLMYVPLEVWPYVFGEFYRVLEPGGVVRITEDETLNPASARYGGWKGSQPAITLTHPAMMRDALSRAGFMVHDVTRETTQYRDASLMQAQHGDPVFFMEGVRPSCLLFAPHFDDETLFAAFTILRYRPAVVVCYPSMGDYGETATREAETREALGVLGGALLESWPGGDVSTLVGRMRDLDARARPSRVWAPDLDTSHPEHRAVYEAALRVFPGRLTTYHTYRDGVKIESRREVPFEPIWIQQKLRALARHASQIRHPRAHRFFLSGLREYYGTDC